MERVRDEDLAVRPREDDPRGRSVHEQMVHQCVSEDLWFRNMLGIDVGAPPLPKQETRLEFMKRYAEDSGKRLAALQEKDEAWWEENVKFFDVPRSRAWVMTRRMTHTSHHRGQLMAMLRMLGRDVHSNYGPTADTGGLMQNHAPTIYAYRSLEDCLMARAAGGAKEALPGGWKQGGDGKAGVGALLRGSLRSLDSRGGRPHMSRDASRLSLRGEGQGQQRFLFDLVRFGAAGGGAGAGAAFYREHVAVAGHAPQAREHVE